MARSEFSAEDFVDHRKFKTSMSVCALKADKRYRDALAECADYAEIYIAVNDTVSAKLAVGNGQMNGYERLGYHAYSSEYLRAILDSGKPVWVYRINDEGSIEKHNLRALYKADQEYKAAA